MTTQIKVRKIMQRLHVSLYVFAEMANVDVSELSSVMFGEGASPGLDTAVNKYIQSIGFCPECLNETIPEGRCRICLCGWSACG